ncbi:MAG: delta-60 repeat domain-containing protein, partial [Flavobacteriales bacterium]|nr:delta-60 repeat domain-containing protein [Flavobacteriales bacterium]
MVKNLLFLVFVIFSGFTYSQPGTLDLTFSPPSTTSINVSTSCIQSDGKILVGGTSSPYILRYNSDGSIDNTFLANPSYWIHSIKIQSDGKILVGGSFTSFNGFSKKGLVRLNNDGTIDNTFNIGTGPNSEVRDIVIQPDGKIIIVGNFSHIDGVLRSKIARINIDGSLDSSFNANIHNDIIHTIFKVNIQSNGKILIGGDFFIIGRPFTGLERLNPDGSVDNGFNIGTGPQSSDVYSISIQQDGKIILTGGFNFFNGTPVGYIVRLNYDGSIDPFFNTNGADAFITASKVLPNGKILLGGYFVFYDNTNNVEKRLVCLNSDGTIDFIFNTGYKVDGLYISSINTQTDGKIIIGGNFTSYDGTLTPNIARLNAYRGIQGIIYNDINNNCIKDSNEKGIPNRFSTINPGNILLETNIDGVWHLDSLPIGSYSVTNQTTDKWLSNCLTTTNFFISNNDSLKIVDYFGLNADFGFANGLMFKDFNTSCINDSNELGLSSKLAIINPGNIIVQSDSLGFWTSDTLNIGSYTITLDSGNNWNPSCISTLNFDILPYGLIDTLYQLGFTSNLPCPSPVVSIDMPFMRPCISNQKIYVEACNSPSGTVALSSTYVIIELDSLITLTSSTLPYTNLGNNTYSFDVGTLNPNECVNFVVNTDVSCNAILGQTLCMQANLYPADSCVFDTVPTPIIGGVQPCTSPWDKSSLSVNGWCQNDSIYFTVTNTGALGNGDMQCYAPVRIYIDGVLTTLDSVLLVGGQTQTFIFEADGRTWRLEADQHPLHPGNSHPNATVELCGNIANWTPNLVNSLPQNDADPVVDIYCGVVRASYDPNDKTGYPLGVSSNHFVTPNGKIDYVIRFQNTGTDTAFTVVIRDTLDVDLDIFSVQSG